MLKREYYREYYDRRKERCRDDYYNRKQKKLENEELYKNYGSESNYYKMKYKQFFNDAEKETESSLDRVHPPS